MSEIGQSVSQSVRTIDHSRPIAAFDDIIVLIVLYPAC